MKNRNTRTALKSSLFCVAFVGLAHVSARADEVLIVGQATGCFGTPCTPVLDTGAADSLTWARPSPAA